LLQEFRSHVAVFLTDRASGQPKNNQYVFVWFDLLQRIRRARRAKTSVTK